MRRLLALILFSSLSMNAWLAAACNGGSCAANGSSQNQTPQDNGDYDDYDDSDDDEEEDCYYYFYNVDLDDTWLEEATWPSKREDSWYNQLVK